VVTSKEIKDIDHKRPPGYWVVLPDSAGEPALAARWPSPASPVERAGIAAKLGFKAHPHMLRHHQIAAILGHAPIAEVVRYTKAARKYARLQLQRHLAVDQMKSPGLGRPGL
jgi:hypothetical protein